MSLIEKAAGKLGGGANKAPVQGNDAPQAPDASLIEGALNKQRSHRSAPFVATPVEPVFKDPETLAMDGGGSQVQSINLARLHRMGVVAPD
ncbi:MAG: protein tyrosine kinase, partial [Gammaproteobacteria bacterium]